MDWVSKLFLEESEAERACYPDQVSSGDSTGIHLGYKAACTWTMEDVQDTEFIDGWLRAWVSTTPFSDGSEKIIMHISAKILICFSRLCHYSI